MQEEEVTVDCECGDKEAVKRTRITRMPKVLLIQLMRFNGATGAKLDHPIGGDFHITVEGAEYELVGALVHTGSSFESGHYYTVTRDIDSKEAYICNDDYPVQQLEGAGLQGALAKAYMLVYQREERRPREEQIPEENKQIHEEEKSGEEEKLGDKIPEEEKRVEEEKLGDKIPEEVKRVEEVEQRKAEQVSTQPRPNAEDSAQPKQKTSCTTSPPVVDLATMATAIKQRCKGCFVSHTPGRFCNKKKVQPNAWLQFSSWILCIPGYMA